MTEFSPEWQAEEQARRDRMAASGLYRAEDEHSSCGVGFVVDLDGKPSRKVVQHGIDALKAIWHRGAVDADGKTGDGAGIMSRFRCPSSMTRFAAPGTSPTTTS
jgi:glutamate synthase domain-containing protein 1